MHVNNVNDDDAFHSDSTTSAWQPLKDSHQHTYINTLCTVAQITIDTRTDRQTTSLNHKYVKISTPPQSLHPSIKYHNSHPRKCPRSNQTQRIGRSQALSPRHLTLASRCPAPRIAIPRRNPQTSRQEVPRRRRHPSVCRCKFDAGSSCEREEGIGAG